jgi:small-conductance mechanosensitive channel
MLSRGQRASDEHDLASEKLNRTLQAVKPQLRQLDSVLARQSRRASAVMSSARELASQGVALQTTQSHLEETLSALGDSDPLREDEPGSV